MRKLRTSQVSIFDAFAEHDIGRELEGMSGWLDEHEEVLEWVEADLKRAGVKATGREGMTVETVLRCGLLKQYRELTYEELAFYLLDSSSFQAFARLGKGGGARRSRRYTGTSVRWVGRRGSALMGV